MNVYIFQIFTSSGSTLILPEGTIEIDDNKIVGIILHMRKYALKSSTFFIHLRSVIFINLSVLLFHS